MPPQTLEVSPLPLLPAPLASVMIKCSACGFLYPPDWFRLWPDAFAAVPTKSGEGFWVPRAHLVDCTKCATANTIEIPRLARLTTVRLGGDDAHRSHAGLVVFTYSLVGVDHKMQPALEDALREVKRSVEPNRRPTWLIHMKDILSGHNRSRHPIFHAWSRRQVTLLIEGVCEVFRVAKWLLAYNMCNTRVISAPAEALKAQTYLALVARVIDEMTAGQAQPHIVFDQEKRSSQARTVYKWARDAFHGTQRCLLYAFLARGLDIPEPAFVPPGSEPALELADFLSFVVARYHHCRWQKIAPEVDPDRLGSISYSAFEPRNGDLVVRASAGFPWSEFYGVK